MCIRILLSLLFSLLCYSCDYKSANKEVSPNGFVDSIKLNLRESQGLLCQTEESWFVSLSYEGKEVPLKMQTYSEDGKKSSLDKIRHKYKVFLRLSPNHCWSCVAEVMKRVRASRVRVAYLIEGNRCEASSALLEFARIDKDYFYTSHQTLEPDSMLEPYFFEISSSAKYQRVFLPNKERPNMITKYLTLHSNK